MSQLPDPNLSDPNTDPSLSADELHTEIERLHLLLLNNSYRLVQRQTAMLDQVATQTESVLEKLKDTAAPISIQQLSSALEHLTKLQVHLAESSTVIFMASLRPLLQLRDVIAARGKPMIVDESSDTPTNEDTLTLDSDGTSLSPEDLDTLKSLGIEVKDLSSSSHQQDDDYKDSD